MSKTKRKTKAKPKPKAKHTPEPWIAKPASAYGTAVKGEYELSVAWFPIASVYHSEQERSAHVDAQTANANAQRAVACVNAMAGVPDPAMAIASRDAKIARLEDALAAVISNTSDNIAVRNAWIVTLEKALQRMIDNACAAAEHEGGAYVIRCTKREWDSHIAACDHAYALLNASDRPSTSARRKRKANI